METYVVSDTKLGSGWESNTNVRKVIGDVTKSRITVFTSVGDLDKMRNEYGYEYYTGEYFTRIQAPKESAVRQKMG